AKSPSLWPARQLLRSAISVTWLTGGNPHSDWPRLVRRRHPGEHCPNPAEYPLYVDLARTVDGEAATIAIAAERGIPLPTDDRKVRRVCIELQSAEPMRTLSIMHST